MSEPWEVVLHHDYRGTPGVILDRSPRRGAPGRVHNVAVPDDFQVDGATAGSGAVRLRGGNSVVQVPLQKPWTLLNGLIVTIVCSSDTLKGGGTLIDGDSVRLDCGPSIVRGTLKGANQTLSIEHGFNGLSDNGWTEIKLTYSGHLFLWGVEYVPGDDEPRQLGVSVVQTWAGPVPSVSRIAIGNRIDGGHGVVGLIDDVQVERLDPLQIDRNFRRRPVDVSVRHCWDEWGRNVLRLLAQDGECAFRVAQLLAKVQNSLIGATQGAGVASQTSQTATSYAEHWMAGRLDQIPLEAIDFINFLRNHGIDLANNRELRELLTDPCFLKALHGLPPLDCDPGFTGMIDAIVRGV